MLIDMGTGVQSSTLRKVKMATAAILEMHKNAYYLAHLLTDLHQIWCADRYSQCKGHIESKITLLENQDGLEKDKNGVYESILDFTIYKR